MDSCLNSEYFVLDVICIKIIILQYDIVMWREMTGQDYLGLVHQHSNGKSFIMQNIKLSREARNRIIQSGSLSVVVILGI